MICDAIPRFPAGEDFAFGQTPLVLKGLAQDSLLLKVWLKSLFAASY